MERRSGRLKFLSTKSMAENDSDAEMSSGSEQEATKPKKQKLKPKNIQSQYKKPRGKRGLLRDVVGMPMDVLFEIFSQLEPMDLLNLSRTTKDLRGILMNRSSKSIWKQAFANVSPPSLPDCPSDLNEPQFAELAFGKACSFCDRKLGIVYVVWEARIRTCNKCLESRFYPPDAYYEPHGLRDYIPSLLKRTYRRKRSFLVYEDFSRQWREKYLELKEAEKRQWLKNKMAERQLIREHAKLCEAWADSREFEQRSQKATMIGERKNIVIDYIRSSGWGDELDKMANTVLHIGNDPTIAKLCQKEVSQRGLEAVSDYLNEYMEDVKDKRIFREQKEALRAKFVTLKEAYTAYILTLPPNEFYPNTADIYGDESVKDILKSSPTELTAVQLDLLNAMFPELVLGWQAPINKQLIELVAEGSLREQYVFDPSSVVNLVATTFFCNHCVKSMQATQMRTHRCARDSIFVYGKMANEEQELLNSTIKETHWNATKCASFSPSISTRIAEILEMCSFDPKTTTVEHFEKLDPIFECLACHSVTTGRWMMRWFGLHAHTNNHSSSRPIKLIVVDEEDAKMARSRMDEESERTHAREPRSTMCTHCRMHGCLPALLDHVKTAHGVAKPKPGVDVIIAPGTSREPLSFSFWPPRLKEDVAEMMGQ